MFFSFLIHPLYIFLLTFQGNVLGFILFRFCIFSPFLFNIVLLCIQHFCRFITKISADLPFIQNSTYSCTSHQVELLIIFTKMSWKLRLLSSRLGITLHRAAFFSTARTCTSHLTVTECQCPTSGGVHFY